MAIYKSRREVSEKTNPVDTDLLLLASRIMRKEIFVVCIFILLIFESLIVTLQKILI